MTEDTSASVGSYKGTNSSDDLQLLRPVFDGMEHTPTSPRDALKQFGQKNIDEESPTQRLCVARMDGVSEMRRDILGIYKNPKTKLNVLPKVRLEDEVAVGSGPVREFLSNAMKIIEEGIPSSTSKPIVFLEGRKDHLLPVHDQKLRLTGIFKALGRIIGHSILHGGPGLYGLSPAAKHYITSSSEENIENGLHITLLDVPDVDLRALITQVPIAIGELLLFGGSEYFLQQAMKCLTPSSSPLTKCFGQQQIIVKLDCSKSGQPEI